MKTKVRKRLSWPQRRRLKTCRERYGRDCFKAWARESHALEQERKQREREAEEVRIQRERDADMQVARVRELLTHGVVGVPRR